MVRENDFSVFEIVQTEFGAYTVSYATGTRGSVPVMVNRMRSEADHALTSSAVVKNGEDVPPSPPVFMMSPLVN